MRCGRLIPTVRVDANGGWTVDEAVAAARALTADGPLEYLEQPCRTVPELAEVRRRVDVPIAADESIRKASIRWPSSGRRAADVAVLKVAPLGGVSALLDIAAEIDIPVVISSALDSAVGIAAGLIAAAALPRLSTPAVWAPAGCSSKTSPTSRWWTAGFPSSASAPTRPGSLRSPLPPTAATGGSPASSDCYPLLAQTDKRARKNQ